MPFGAATFTTFTSGSAINLSPVGGGPLEPEALLSAAGALFHRVAADHQLRNQAALGEPIRDGAVGPAVDLAHPPHADDADAECVSHSNLLQRPRSTVASTQAPSRRLDSDGGLDELHSQDTVFHGRERECRPVERSIVPAREDGIGRARVEVANASRNPSG